MKNVQWHSKYEDFLSTNIQNKVTYECLKLLEVR